MAEGRRAHRQSRTRAGSAPLLDLAANGAGALLTGFAWIYLVSAAIDFGTAAVRGRSLAWVFTFGASVGAAVCLLLMLTLVGRGMRTLGYLSDYQPRRAAARRRRESATRTAPPPRRGTTPTDPRAAVRPRPPAAAGAPGEVRPGPSRRRPPPRGRSGRSSRSGR